MKILVRLLAVTTFVAGSMSSVGAAQADPGPVPKEWGKPVIEGGGVGVVGRQDGRILGRPGNQHVTAFYINTYTDTLPYVSGEVTDWWCPQGVTAPDYSDALTDCKEKANYWIRFDGSAASPFIHRWAPNLRFMTVRVPISVIDYPYDTVVHTAAVTQGTASLRLRATGSEETQIFYDAGEVDDRSSFHMRAGKVVGGRFLGKAWLTMDGLGVDSDMSLTRYYKVPV